MPAGIDTTTGEAAFVYDRTGGDPWHRKGIPVDGAMTVDEVFEACPALGFIVEKRPIGFRTALDPVEAGVIAAEYAPWAEWQAVVRTDTNAPLGMVRPTYRLYQNREGAEFAVAVAGESGEGIDTGGSLWGGAQVFFCLNLGKDLVIPGDPSPIARRLVVTWGHDGRHALRAVRTHIRVVCANTLNESIGAAVAEFSVRHTATMEDRVADAQRLLGLAAAHDAAFDAKMLDLATRPVHFLSEVTAFTEKLLPVNPQAEKPFKTEAARALIADLYTKSPNLDGVPFTEYRLLQATVEWADHFRTYRAKRGDVEDARAEAILGGSASTIKARALALLG